MGNFIGAVCHGQCSQYSQRILDSFFSSEQDLVQITLKMDSIAITFLLAARRCWNAVLWCSISLQEFLHYIIIKY